MPRWNREKMRGGKDVELEEGSECGRRFDV
jgi:hypothetical protein